MSGGIVPLDDAVAVFRQERAVRRQKHRADGDFTAFAGGFGFPNRECYGFGVIHARLIHCQTIQHKRRNVSPRCWREPASARGATRRS